MKSWVEVVVRRLGGTRVAVLPLLRVLAVIAGVVWVAMAPHSFPGWTIVAGTVLGFFLWSTLVLTILWVRPRPVLRLNFWVMVVDVAFALTLIRLSGGARSTLFLALLLIAGLQSYYYGIRRGVVVAGATAIAYLAVAWPTIAELEVANTAIRLAMLLGTAIGVGLLADIEESERRKVAALSHNLETRERFIQSVIESLREGVVALDRDARVVAWNPAMEARCGVTAADAIGREFFSVLPNFRHGPLVDPLQRLLRGELAEFTLEALEHETSRKGRVVLNVKANLLRLNGRPAGAVLLTENITERVSLERSARQAEKLASLGTLAAGLAHELNNPIGIISSRAELMLLEAESRPVPDNVRDDLQVLHRHAQRVARLIQALLSFARRAPGDRGPVSLNEVIGEALLLVEKQTVKEGISLRAELAPDLPKIWGDSNALEQVVMNLVTNARDAVKDGGEIFIGTGLTPSGSVRLVMRDTGHGIPSEVLAQIFDPFFTTKREGTGLGLAIAYGIVQEHRGTIDVQSTPGQGTTFVITLPAIDGSEPA